MPSSLSEQPPAAVSVSGPPTASVPLNVAIGGTPVAASNIAMSMAAGTEIPIIAGGLNVILEYVKNKPWFHEQTWTVPLLILLAFGASVGIWHFLAGDDVRAIVNGFGILTQAHINYAGAKVMGVGILGPTAPENKHQEVGG